LPEKEAATLGEERRGLIFGVSVKRSTGPSVPDTSEILYPVFWGCRLFRLRMERLPEAFVCMIGVLSIEGA